MLCAMHFMLHTIYCMLRTIYYNDIPYHMVYINTTQPIMTCVYCNDSIL